MKTNWTALLTSLMLVLGIAITCDLLTSGEITITIEHKHSLKIEDLQVLEDLQVPVNHELSLTPAQEKVVNWLASR